jgi:fructokinase
MSSKNSRYSIVGIGEILWDMFPNGKKLGGAPANLIYHISKLGHIGTIITRIGNDVLGKEILKKLSENKINTSFIQVDGLHPTGTVNISFNPSGQPYYEIKKKVAWDFIEWQHSFNDLLNKTNAICFGSLAQRSNISRHTIKRFLRRAIAKKILR